jgi:SNF2 family DNA or RNA helicase
MTEVNGFKTSGWKRKIVRSYFHVAFLLVNYVSIAQLAITRLQTVLNTFLLRRKKDTKLDGKVLIELPKKEVILQRLEFSEEEREIYDAVSNTYLLCHSPINAVQVEKRMQTQFNRFLRAGSVLK